MEENAASTSSKPQSSDTADRSVVCFNETENLLIEKHEKEFQIGALEMTHEVAEESTDFDANSIALKSEPIYLEKEEHKNQPLTTDIYLGQSTIVGNSQPLSITDVIDEEMLKDTKNEEILSVEIAKNTHIEPTGVLANSTKDDSLETVSSIPTEPILKANAKADVSLTPSTINVEVINMMEEEGSSNIISSQKSPSIAKSDIEETKNYVMVEQNKTLTGSVINPAFSVTKSENAKEVITTAPNFGSQISTVSPGENEVTFQSDESKNISPKWKQESKKADAIACNTKVDFMESESVIEDKEIDKEEHAIEGDISEKLVMVTDTIIPDENIKENKIVTIPPPQSATKSKSENNKLNSASERQNQLKSKMEVGLVKWHDSDKSSEEEDIQDIDLDSHETVSLINEDFVLKVKKITETVSQNYRKGQTVTDVHSYLNEEQLKTISKPEAQVALYNVAKRIGPAPTIHKTIICELSGNKENTQTFGSKALLVALEKSSISMTPLSLAAKFQQKDFDFSKAKSTLCQVINEACSIEEQQHQECFTN